MDHFTIKHVNLLLAAIIALPLALLSPAPSLAQIAQPQSLPKPQVGAPGQTNPAARAITMRGYSAFEAKNYSVARLLFEQACAQGDALACALASDINTFAEYGAINLSEAQLQNMRGCYLGRAESCTTAGIAFKNTPSTATNQSQARVLFKRGCDAGHAVGCAELARLLILG